MKDFVITVDTEGDDLWHWQPNKPITTDNSKYIPRFQELCENYGFRPVYLTNYEMAMDDLWVQYASQKAKEGKCEIGMHLHAWNTPPEYALKNNFSGNPYITEYPEEIIDAKVAAMVQLLRDKFEQPIVSHRAGRWATNEVYFRSLARHGIRVDCSVTPEVDLSAIPGCEKNCGNDYRNVPKGTYRIHPDILEVPMTTRRVRHCREGSFKHRVKTLILGDGMWLRPLQKSVEPLKYLTERVLREKDCNHLEFMIHSSELMPGGSPYFQTEESVDVMYKVMEEYFRYISHLCGHKAILQDFVINRDC